MPPSALEVLALPIRNALRTLLVHRCGTWSCRLALCAVGHNQSRGIDTQVQHLVEEARSKATSIQQSVSKALTGKSEEGFTMGMRSNLPSYAPQPAFVRFLKSGALPRFLLCPSACNPMIQVVRCRSGPPAGLKSAGKRCAYISASQWAGDPHCPPMALSPPMCRF